MFPRLMEPECRWMPERFHVCAGPPSKFVPELTPRGAPHCAELSVFIPSRGFSPHWV